MSKRKIRIALMESAKTFLILMSLPEKAQKKISYNLLKVQEGEIDKELFKKLENSDIWESVHFSTEHAIDYLHFGIQKPRP